MEQIRKDFETDEPDIEPDPDPTAPSDPGDDPNTGSDSIMNEYTPSIPLENFFPFCIPFDIYNLFACLNAEPEAPKFDFTFNFGQYLGVHTLTIDLSQWDSIALLLRRLQLLLFCVGLAFKTRDLIKG